MMDINKLIATENMSACEAEVFLNDMESWTEQQARDLARSQGLELSDEHMDVICWLRDLYADCGKPENGRALTHAMEETFSDQGGKKYLYWLFPNGPVLQGCRLAGLPVPESTVDRSFGRAWARVRGVAQRMRPMKRITLQGLPSKRLVFRGGRATWRSSARFCSSLSCAAT